MRTCHPRKLDEILNYKSNFPPRGCAFINRTGNFCESCTPRATIPGVGVQHLLYPPGTSVGSERPCHNTRNVWKFCNTSMPVPETSGSFERLPYPPPVIYKNPTEHNLVNNNNNNYKRRFVFEVRPTIPRTGSCPCPTTPTTVSMKDPRDNISGHADLTYRFFLAQ